MKIEEIIQRVQSLYSRGVQSDDTRLTSRHIYNKILTVRSKLITQESKKKQKINQWNYQTLSCVELEKALPYECPCVPQIGCEILKTKHPLPKPLTNLNNHLIQSVTSLDGSIIYSEIGWIEKKYKSSNKYTGNKPDYYIRDEKIYITHKNGPKIISITGVFEDPLEAENYPSICNTESEECESPLERELPIDNDMVDTLVEMSVNELIILFSQSQEDLTNNSRDSNVEPSK